MTRQVPADADPPAAQDGAVAGSTRKRAVWTMVDQVASSGSNVILSIVVARVLGAAALGRITLVFSTYLLALGLSRAVVHEPLVMLFTARSPQRLRSAAGQAAGAAGLLGTVIGAVLVGGVLLALLPTAFAILGVALPFLLVQDTYRYFSFGAGRAARAAASDVSWLLLFLVIVLLLAHPTVNTLFLGWCIGGVVGCVLGVVAARTWPVHRVRSFIRDVRTVSARLFVEFVVVGVTGQVSLMLIGALAGLAALGQVRAGLLLIAPLSVALQGMTSFLVPELVRRRNAAGAAAAEQLARRAWVVFVVLGLAVGISLRIVPLQLVHAVLGSATAAARSLAVYVAIYAVAETSVWASRAALRAAADVRTSLRLRMCAAPAVLVASVVGAELGGATGAMIGLAATNAATGLLWSSKVFYRRRSAGVGGEVAVEPAVSDSRVLVTQ